MILFAVQAGRSKDLQSYFDVCWPALNGLTAQIVETGPAPRRAVFRHPSSIHAAYEEAREAALRLPLLEALVLVQADVALMSPWFLQVVRRTMLQHDGKVVAGVAGVEKAPPSIAWWEGQGLRGGTVQRNGGAFHTFGMHEVEALDGVCLVLSPWAVRTLRFDPATYGDSWHGYDCDISFACRAAGGKCFTMPLVAYHHAEVRAIDEGWHEADRRFVAKWRAKGLLP